MQPSTDKETRYTVLKTLGWFYIAVGLVSNPWVIGRLLSSNGSIDEPGSKGIIWLFEVLVIVFGILSIKKGKTELIINLNLLVWTVIIITPLLGEMMFRTGIALNIKRFKSPSLYADSSSDNDYWNLQRIWEGWQSSAFVNKNGKGLLRKSERVHPLLGWAEANITENNPFGLQEDALKQMERADPKILFYGDSFVKGASDKEFQIPKYMDRKMDGVDVVDLGVGGYGLDQIYLLFKETYQKAANPLIVVGILANDDLDRTILSVRTSQKPYFVIDAAGDLQLKGIPIEKDQQRYFQHHPLSMKSYLVAFLKQKWSKKENKLNTKKRISSELLERFKTDAHTAQNELLFVMFYGQQSLRKTDWQDEFLKEKLDQMGAHYIDTKELLLQYAQENHLELSSFYVQGNGHHNNLGNQVIAEGIINYIRAHKLIKTV